MRYHKHKQQHSKKNRPHDKKHEGPLGEKEKITAYTLSTDAKGIGKLEDGSIVFVEDLLPQETATVQVISKKSSYKRARVVHRHNDSPERTTPPCPYYASCGGCQLQHIKSENQLDHKVQWFFETLKRVGKWDENKIKILSKKFSLVSLSNTHYRRRIRLHFNGKTLGFYAQESHQIIDIQHCLITRNLINEKLETIKKTLCAFYSEQTKEHPLPQFEFDVEITESDEEKLLFHILNLSSSNQPLDGEFTKKIKPVFEKAFQIQPDQLLHLKHPQLGKFKIKKESFVQPHFSAIEVYCNNIFSHLQTFCHSLLPAMEKHGHGADSNSIIAWDLYAGSGIFSALPQLALQKQNHEVKTVAVEGVPESIDSLKLNLNEFNVVAHVQDVSDFIDTQFEKRNEIEKANIIILDPPRSGVGIANMQKIVELCAQECCVLYLGCDPASFARDTQILLQGGFQPQHVTLFDSFGQTFFYETLGYFTKGV
jgi:23S rRNA (uracil1939-C5)-methyltransferase